uniref:LAM_G_DOMAIN domain-containing protein n=1 Tax=Elaeophora elaphi TaxID=1147741 RepID=A0A0R3S2E6_9BILA
MQCVFSQEYICPDNTMYLDLKPCNPNDRNQCPKNFACRRSRFSRSGIITDEVIHLCCEANNMTIGSWFEELELSPQIFPQLPSFTLDYVNISDFDAKHPSPVIHLGDELQVLNYPNYLTANIQGFQFQSITPTLGGYLHAVLLIDITKRPTALFINYDLPSTGSVSVNVENITDSKHRFFGYISSGTVPLQDTYRQQYVVIIYKTEVPLSDQVNVTADVIGFIDQISYFISNSATGQALGKPIAGLFFYASFIFT